MRNGLARRGWVLLVGLVLAGCISARYTEGEAIPWDSVAQIQPGQTTKDEVLAAFGAPQNFSNPSALAEFLENQGLESDAYSRYPFADVFAYQANYGALRGFTLILYTRLELKIVSNLVLIYFDEEGVVTHLGVRRATDGHL
jgi:outer membrane protein assembly factor BamE (lipoprotein component of BamABCDE complex)